MFVYKESQVFQDFAGHDLVVLTYEDQFTHEFRVIPVFLTTAQEVLWEEMTNELKS